MIRSRINHWSCSKFANWVRGVDKPFALEWGKWDEWKKEQQKKRPIRFWIAEKGLSKLQNFLMFPFDVYHTIKCYVDNRWITKTHYMKTGLKAGRYYELDHRILHSLFNELVDFIEIEYAHLAKWTDKDKKYKFKNGRSEEAGTDYLNWVCDLKYDSDYGINKKDPKYKKPTEQAIAAQKTRDLYLWWKEVRPNRPDPMVASGLDWSDKKEDTLLSGKTTKKELSDFKKLEKIEAIYDKEDTKMLIELIKIRHNLWS